MNYTKIKKIIDDYHKDFIHKSLSGVKLEALDEFEKLYFLPSKDDKTQKEFEKLAVGVKQKIYELLDSGNKNEALAVISQLQAILPEDEELKELFLRSKKI